MHHKFLKIFWTLLITIKDCDQILKVVTYIQFNNNIEIFIAIFELFFLFFLLFLLFYRWSGASVAVRSLDVNRRTKRKGNGTNSFKNIIS